MTFPHSTLSSAVFIAPSRLFIEGCCDRILLKICDAPLHIVQEEVAEILIKKGRVTEVVEPKPESEKQTRASRIRFKRETQPTKDESPESEKEDTEENTKQTDNEESGPDSGNE